jgi:hypothetical protein
LCRAVRRAKRTHDRQKHGAFPFRPAIDCAAPNNGQDAQRSAHGDRRAEIAPLSDKESARDFKIFVIPELHRAA